MQLLRKISAATVIGGKETVLETVMKDKGKSHTLYRVIGIANDAKEGQGKVGFADWKCLLGNFEATNLLTGEVFRSGIEAVHQGQMEAAQMLGMTRLAALRIVILPQAMRVVLPPLGNFAIGLLKDTALASAVAAPELPLELIHVL